MFSRRVLMYAKYRTAVATLAGSHVNNIIMAKPKVVFVLGGPGAGKGTQCQNIVEHFGYIHLSAGDLLREERQNPDSKVGQEIDTHIREGSIVPVEITCGLLEKAMQQNIEKRGKEHFLIDGFPRNQDNLDGWERQMGGKADVKFMLFFDCTEETCIQRCLSRGQGGSGRTDDNEESLKKRIVTYNKSTMPIINHYEKCDLVKKVDANRSPEEVFEDVKKEFQ